MTRKLLILTTLGLLLSGCYMAPMALLGPATSGFSTASIISALIFRSLSKFFNLSLKKNKKSLETDSFENLTFCSS